MNAENDNRIFALQQAIEKCIHVKKEAHYALTGLEKVYDNMNSPELWTTCTFVCR